MAESQEQIQTLFEKMIGGSLSSAERMSLEKLVQASKENQQYYLDLCQMHAMLAEEHGAFASGMGTLSQATKVKKTKSPLLQLVLALAALITLSFLALQWNSNQVKPPSLYGSSPVAVLSYSVGSQFSGGQKLKQDEVLFEGVYELEKGIIEIAYDNGTKIVVESPATFELFKNNSLGMSSGKVSATVPLTGKGFTVNALGVSIVDLGTEFSVYVKPEKYLEAHVFKGLVELAMHYETEDVNYTLREGHAVRVMVGSRGPVLAGIDLKEDFFLRFIKEPQNSYSDLIISKKPVAYYPMNINAAGRVLEDWSEFKNHGKVADVKDQASLWVAGKVGSAIHLSGSNNKAFVYVDDYPKAKENQLTVVGWAYAESRPMWATIVKNWGEKIYGQFHFGLSPAGLLDVEVSPREGERVHITDNKTFPIQSWQHVAFVHNGTSVKIFRNGKVVGSAKVNGIHYPTSLKKMSIGTKLGDSENAPAASPGHWDGRLDEIAIFNQALSEAEILELYETSK
jgi:hypothetical protein